MNGFTDVFCKDRSSPLLIGSVKSNMGHSEPASGLCSIAKILLSMENGMIPPNLHFKNPNKDIPALSDGRLQVSWSNLHSSIREVLYLLMKYPVCRLWIVRGHSKVVTSP